jgi:hypothetical protein
VFQQTNRLPTDWWSNKRDFTIPTDQCNCS